MGSWYPKNWYPDYDKMVALYFIGKEPEAIADILGYKLYKVQGVLNSHIGRAAMKGLRENRFAEISEKLKDASAFAADNILHILSNSEIREKYPFKVLEYSADLLKASGHLQDTSNKAPIIQNNNVNVIPQEGQAKILEGINELKRLGVLPTKEIKVIEAGESKEAVKQEVKELIDESVRIGDNKKA